MSATFFITIRGIGNHDVRDFCHDYGQAFTCIGKNWSLIGEELIILEVLTSEDFPHAWSPTRHDYSLLHGSLNTDKRVESFTFSLDATGN